MPLGNQAQLRAAPMRARAGWNMPFFVQNRKTRFASPLLGIGSAWADACLFLSHGGGLRALFNIPEGLAVGAQWSAQVAEQSHTDTQSVLLPRGQRHNNTTISTLGNIHLNSSQCCTLFAPRCVSPWLVGTSPVFAAEPYHSRRLPCNAHLMCPPSSCV